MGSEMCIRDRRVSYDGFDAKHDEDLSLADADARVLQGPRPDAATVARLVAAAAAARGAAPARGEVCAICCVGDDDASDESDDGDDGALFARAACAKQRAAAARAEEEGPPRNQLRDELVEPKAFVRLECGHAFHRLCVLPWLAKHRTCPTRARPPRSTARSRARAASRASRAARSTASSTARRPTSRAGSPRSRARRRSSAVSYTHLTLPTKRIV